MAEYIIQEETLIDIADAIREKEGGSEVGPVSITWDGDTAGKICVTLPGGVLCKLSDLVCADEVIKTATITVLAGTETIPYSMSEMWESLPDTYRTEGVTYLEIAAFVRQAGAQFGDIVFPETGVYLIKGETGGGFYTNSVTLPAVSSGKELIPVLEFKPRIKALSGGEQATPEITVSGSGLITATAGDKSATKQLSTQGGKTITPGDTEQIAVAAGKYVTGDVIVAAVENTGGGADGVSFVTSAVGILPYVARGTANSQLSKPGFETSAVGTIS